MPATPSPPTRAIRCGRAPLSAAERGAQAADARVWGCAGPGARGGRRRGRRRGGAGAAAGAERGAGEPRGDRDASGEPRVGRDCGGRGPLRPRQPRLPVPVPRGAPAHPREPSRARRSAWASQPRGAAPGSSARAPRAAPRAAGLRHAGGRGLQRDGAAARAAPGVARRPAGAHPPRQPPGPRPQVTASGLFASGLFASGLFASGLFAFLRVDRPSTPLPLSACGPTPCRGARLRWCKSSETPRSTPRLCPARAPRGRSSTSSSRAAAAPPTAPSPGAPPPPPPPPLRTKWTRRVPHPVLTGHVSLRHPVLPPAPPGLGLAHVRPRAAGAWRGRVQPDSADARHRGQAAGAQGRGAGGLGGDVALRLCHRHPPHPLPPAGGRRPAPPHPKPPPPPLVLSGHAASLTPY